MIIGIGTDIIEVARITSSIEKYGDRFRNRIFTQIEQDYCETFKANKFLHYAARFAAKEAFSKAIGTGLTQGFKFIEIWVRNEASGEPKIELSGGLAEKWGKYKFHVSLSHTAVNAVAYVIIED